MLNLNRVLEDKMFKGVSEVFLRKGLRKIYSKFTGEHPCRSVISIKLQNKFIEIVLRHWCSSVNLLHFFRTPFLRTPLEGCFCNIFSTNSFFRQIDTNLIDPSIVKTNV